MIHFIFINVNKYITRHNQQNKISTESHTIRFCHIYRILDASQALWTVMRHQCVGETGMLRQARCGSICSISLRTHLSGTESATSYSRIVPQKQQLGHRHQPTLRISLHHRLNQVAPWRPLYPMSKAQEKTCGRPDSDFIFLKIGCQTRILTKNDVGIFREEVLWLPSVN